MYLHCVKALIAELVSTAESRQVSMTGVIEGITLAIWAYGMSSMVVISSYEPTSLRETSRCDHIRPCRGSSMRQAGAYRRCP
jgi:hypothetical protein